MYAKKGLNSLIEEVFKRDLCLSCGACVNLCPYLLSVDGRIGPLGDCEIEEGRCYNYCPRTSVDFGYITEKIFNSTKDLGELGSFKAIYMARGIKLDTPNQAQYGGVVSSLIIYALDEGIIDGAILTKSNALGSIPEMVKRGQDVLKFGKSKYSISPTISEVHKAVKEDYRELGVVALPCQVLALRKMQLYEPKEEEKRFHGVKLVMGLFCTWALDQIGFRNYLKERLLGEKPVKMDVPPPPARIFEIYLEQGKKEFPLDEVKQHMKPSCSYCVDMTAEFADISLGAVEGVEGWDTVIIRTELGVELFRRAEKKGYLEVEPLDMERLKALKEASRNKKERAINEVEKLEGMPYRESLLSLIR